MRLVFLLRCLVIVALIAASVDLFGASQIETSSTPDEPIWPQTIILDKLDTCLTLDERDQFLQFVEELKIIDPSSQPAGPLDLLIRCVRKSVNAIYDIQIHSRLFKVTVDPLMPQDQQNIDISPTLELVSLIYDSSDGEDSNITNCHTFATIDERGKTVNRSCSVSSQAAPADEQFLHDGTTRNRRAICAQMSRTMLSLCSRNINHELQRATLSFSLLPENGDVSIALTYDGTPTLLRLRLQYASRGYSINYAESRRSR